jgi:protein-tyrosine phosphatase
MTIPGVDHVLDGVFISGIQAHRAMDTLRTADIRHVLKLYHYEPHWPADFTVCENPVLDGQRLPPGTLERGVGFVREQVEAGRRVLVQCGAGISRSSTFVLAYLVESGLDLKAAFALLRQCHPQAWPLPALWASLLDHYALPYSMDEALGWTFSPPDGNGQRP